MRKTALQQYIDELKSSQETAPSHYMVFQSFIDKAQSYMKEEQEQLEEAYNYGAFYYDENGHVESNYTNGDDTQFFIDKYGYNLK